MASKLRRGEGNVQPYTLADGSTRYRARWYEDGKVKSRSFQTEQAAHQHLIAMSTDKRLGTYVQALDITVKDAVSRYLKRNAGEWATNTSATYGQIARSHIYPHIGNERMATLSTSRLQAWVERLVKQKLSPSVIGNARIILSGTCADLVRLGELARNPVPGVKIPAKRKSHKVLWTDEEVRAVLDAATKYPQMAVYYRVALTTGMRPGEIRALMWADIDFDKGTIICRRTVTRDERFRQIVGTSTKTDRIRTIAVPASTIAALRELRKDQLARRIAAERWAATDLVFDRGDGHLIAQQTLRHRHADVCRIAGVPQCRFHELRHLAAMMLLKRGVHPKIVSDILGHSSISITLDLYSHSDVSMQRAATDMLGDVADGNG